MVNHRTRALAAAQEMAAIVNPLTTLRNQLVLAIQDLDFVIMRSTDPAFAAQTVVKYLDVVQAINRVFREATA